MITHDPNNPIDRAIVQFQAGRDRAENFQVIYRRFYAPVKSFFAKRVASEDVLDLTQETFLGIYTGLDRYRWEARFAGWLFSIAANAYRKWCRHRGRGQHPGTLLALAGGSEVRAVEDQQLVVVDCKKNPQEEVLSKEQLESLRRAIEELPPKMQQCLKLRLDQELAYQEIAEFLELSIETVKAHLHQAKKKLRELLSHDFESIDF